MKFRPIINNFPDDVEKKIGIENSHENLFRDCGF